MKRITIALALISSIAQAQLVDCPQDTLVIGGIPSGAYNWSQGTPTSASCPFSCPYNAYNCWQLPDSIDFDIHVAGNSFMPFGDANIVLMLDCHLSLYDTCNAIGHPFVAPFNFFASVPPNTQVCVFWDSTTTDSVGVLVKSDATPKPILDSILMDIDTCGGVSFLETSEGTAHRYRYIDPYTMKDVWQIIPRQKYLIRPN
jgi:hypothetical protein